ncbi:hypothetical protein TL16_g07080 [Triparma laevis f. inornata]|uniref:Uncharacterized protein n=1 Tax=Triparma laevis f. inornata TaxID=1714386 RepID=A0A9W7ARL6_9STRA|nr:hypothetical protein TL16_g07080 [Triparma laevis f. inornata]
MKLFILLTTLAVFAAADDSKFGNLRAAAELLSEVAPLVKTADNATNLAGNKVDNCIPGTTTTLKQCFALAKTFCGGIPITTMHENGQCNVKCNKRLESTLICSKTLTGPNGGTTTYTHDTTTYGPNPGTFLPGKLLLGAGGLLLGSDTRLVHDSGLPEGTCNGQRSCREKAKSWCEKNGGLGGVVGEKPKNVNWKGFENSGVCRVKCLNALEEFTHVCSRTGN